MTEYTLDAHRSSAAISAKKGRHANHRVGLESATVDAGAVISPPSFSPTIGSPADGLAELRKINKFSIPYLARPEPGEHVAVRFFPSARSMAETLRKQLLDTTRGRIVSLLQPGGLTSDHIASRLGVTRSAIRVQITAMERDGVVRRVGKRPGTTRPSHVFELTPELEQLLSKAYVPLLTHLVAVFAAGLPADQVDALLRHAGKRLATELSHGSRPAGTLAARVAIASEMMNEHLGARTHVEGDRDDRPRCCFEIRSRRSPRRA